MPLSPSFFVKSIIFDFDGTIADSFDLVLTISNRLAAEFGYPRVQPEEVKRLKNLSSREIVRQSGVSMFQLPFLLQRLRRELQQEIGTLKLIPGMREVLLALKQRGHPLGIVTSNSQENVMTFLKAQDLHDVFDFVSSGLTLFGKGRVIRQAIRRNHLDEGNAIYVGDETRDIEAAKRIRIRVISVTWGYSSREVLASQQPDFLAEHPEELVKIIDGCSGVENPVETPRSR